MDDVMMAGAMGLDPTLADVLALRETTSAVSALLDASLEMEEAMTAAAFRATAYVVDRVEADG